MRGNLRIVMGVLALSSFAACDPSKAELDKTKTELQAVTTERDSLKTQLATAQQQLAAAQQQMTAAQQQAAEISQKHGEHMKEHAAAINAPRDQHTGGAAKAATPAQQVKQFKTTQENKVTKGGSSIDQ